MGSDQSAGNAGVEHVVLLDQDGEPIGSMPKLQVHGPDTPLHQAFSVYVFDPAGRFLVTRRALRKPTWAGTWTNSCCGHPEPGEEVAEAALRRLRQELGLVPTSLDLVLPDFGYRAVSPEGLVEHERCPVFTAVVEADPQPDPDEVVQWRWEEWPAFTELTRASPWAVSPWSVLQVEQMSQDSVPARVPAQQGA
jgi:isopentenyl-diphosphate delta-isomerase